MRFIRYQDKPCFVISGIFGFLAMAFALEAFRENSWAKWSRLSFMDCLPLPPPVGCLELYTSRDVLSRPDTDFSWLTLTSTIPLSIYVFSMIILSTGQDYGSEAVREVVNRRFRTFLLAVAASLNFLTFLIVTFRVGVTSTITVAGNLFQDPDISVTYSTSYYLVILSCTCSVLAILCQYRYEGCQESLTMVKTIKQHLCRDLLNPANKESSKMITFSSMDPEMEEAAAEIAVRATMHLKLEEDIAEHVKQDFEAQFGPTWHCAVGPSFGSAVHHRANEYIEIALPKVSILLFRVDEPCPLKPKGKPSQCQSSMSDSSVCC